MNIFYVCYSDLKRQTAWRTHTLEVVERLSKKGHNVHLFIPKKWAPEGKFHFKTVFIPVIPGKFISFFSFQFFLLLKILILGLKTKPKVIYVREYFVLYATVIAASLLKAKHIVEANSVISDILTNLNASNFKIWLSNKVQLKTFKKSSAIITVTEGMKNRLVAHTKLPVEKFYVIPNGANTELFNIISKQEAAKKLGLPYDVPYLGFVGLIYPWRRIDFLINMTNYLMEKYTNIKLIIVGDGDEMEKLKLLAGTVKYPENIIFTGEVKYEEVPLYMNLIDIPFIFWDTIYNSDHGSPVKLYEFLACGKKMLTNIESEYYPILKELDGGEGIPLDDFTVGGPVIEKCIKEWDNESYREELRKIIIKEFSWDITVNKIEDILNKNE